MKKSYIKLFSIELVMLIMIIFNIFISSIFTMTNLANILFWFITVALLIYLVGFPKDKHLHKTDILQIVFIYSIVYFLAIYIFGFFFGFLRNVLSFSFINILTNTVPVLLFILFQEITRCIVVSKGKENKIIISLLIIIFIIFDIMYGIRLYSFNEAMGIFEFIGLLVLPSIAKNLLLTYIVYKNSYKVAILYRLLFDLLLFVLPIYPALGAYFGSLLGIIFPVVLFLKINTFFAITQPSTIRKSNFKKLMIWIPSISILLVIIILTSGIFKFYWLAVGSDSMRPSINRNDVVIIEKLTEEQLYNLRENDIIAYEQDNRILIHRIVKVDVVNNRRIYNTKGDNNEAIDPYDVTHDQIKGIIRLRMPIIGYPSVRLDEVLNRAR